MKRRVTLTQHANAPFDASQLELSSKSLTIRDLDALREERITLDFEEIPEQVHRSLQVSRELHIRWATEQPYNAVAPFTSRVSPGLHVFYTPQKEGQTSAALCSQLNEIFGVFCDTIKENFITPPNGTATPTTLQFHTKLPLLDTFADSIARLKCDGFSHREERAKSSCQDFASSLRSADYVDIDYDSTSQVLNFSVFWTNTPGQGWNEVINGPTSKSDKVEFGLLGADSAPDPEDLKVGGLLATIGTDKKLKPTVFHFPSRHHSLPEPASYTVSFSRPTGLHPTLSITIPQSGLARPPAPEYQECSLHTYLTLPSSIFGDQYQLGTTDPLFLASHNLAGLRAHAGETDLEAPDWAVTSWGSTWLFDLATPPEESLDQAANWTATIPLHLRYLRPAEESGYETVHVPWPVVFWACSSDDETPLGLNPFDRTSLGWDGHFGPHTLFYQFRPNGDPLVELIDVPVLHKDAGSGLFQTRNIEIATSAVISLGFLWVLWRLVMVACSSGIRANTPAKGESHEKKE